MGEGGAAVWCEGGQLCGGGKAVVTMYSVAWQPNFDLATRGVVAPVGGAMDPGGNRIQIVLPDNRGTRPCIECMHYSCYVCMYTGNNMHNIML